jgi:tripeptide aminopeptidase
MLACAERARPDVALLFTVREEQALAGAKECDPGWLDGATVYIYDHATPIGEIIVAAPTYYRIDAEFCGQAAHAGICPENGRSAVRAAARAITAMPHGRLDPETTANAAMVRGGAESGTNIVAPRCVVVSEVRSRAPGRAEEVVSDVVDAFQEAANDPRDPCDLTVNVEQLFVGYSHAPDAPAVVAAADALSRCGHRVKLVASGGASDANAFIANGITAVCLANGTEAAHEPTERASRTALADMAAVIFALLKRAADF